MRCEGHLKNWNQCRKNAVRTVLEVPLPPAPTQEQRIAKGTYHYCDTHAEESLASGLAREIQ